ncbi:hypothetical protein UREG_04007 [Uncinocarpus reesii 1704]|uniref:PPIase cyclophilin-type domain-containing protein n=1 Tax=Uncinocarpus reesii (strain UAMH 1704) TaxID=336963 RepID=C4JME9_UNCRE|nr:uncharacterized protein UREG_04007 [Uncinocarpus reesii 1704]EEP79161.1 hypothetical protein UREG_04007 [Uncinocarpus reesii 1704]
MSSHYNTEPPPTASATIHTTAGSIQISLFAKQTPLACKNFLQHCLDGYYTNTTFHRVVPNFVVQAGDPTGSGSGGSSIYEDAEFERDPRDPSQKIVFGDELHSRLKFNRRGLVGMAKGEDGRYGSQFFVTLAPADRELTGTCPFEGQLRKREKIAVAGTKNEDKKLATKKKKKQTKTGKTLLSFGAGEEDEGDLPAIKPGKPKFNTSLIAAEEKRREPFAKGKAQIDALYRGLPLPDPESPRSPSPSSSPDQSAPRSKASQLNAQIESLKASMRRTTKSTPNEPSKSKSALESLIPANSIRGRKRPAPGSTNGIDLNGRLQDEEATLKRLNDFKARLEQADAEAAKKPRTSKSKDTATHHPDASNKPNSSDEPEDEEAQVCDLHFIVNCQSCRAWDLQDSETGAGDNAAREDDNATDWMTHALRFAKDTLGKDHTWKESNRDADGLVVIDPRQKEKQIRSGRKQESGRDRERTRESERERKMEWARQQGYSH